MTIHHYIKEEHTVSYHRFHKAVSYCGKVIKAESRTGRITPEGHDACYINNIIENRIKRSPEDQLCQECLDDPQLGLDTLGMIEL